MLGTFLSLEAAKMNMISVRNLSFSGTYRLVECSQTCKQVMMTSSSSDDQMIRISLTDIVREIHPRRYGGIEEDWEFSVCRMEN